jgi:hypothetical protein
MAKAVSHRLVFTPLNSSPYLNHPDSVNYQLASRELPDYSSVSSAAKILNHLRSVHTPITMTNPDACVPAKQDFLRRRNND